MRVAGSTAVLHAEGTHLSLSGKISEKMKIHVEDLLAFGAQTFTQALLREDQEDPAAF